MKIVRETCNWIGRVITNNGYVTRICEGLYGVWKTKSLGITAKVHVTINNGRYEELSINEKKKCETDA